MFERFKRKSPQTYIVPTRFGFVFFVVFVLMLLVGATYQNNMVFIMAFLLFSLAVIGMVQTHHNIDGLLIENLFVEPGFSKGKGRIRMRVRSLKKRKLYVNTFEFENASAHTEVIEPTKINIIEGAIQYGERGRYQVKRVRVKTVFPYGLFVAWQWHKVSAEYIVYPERLGAQLMPEKFDAEGEDYSGHRKYQSGDSLKHVDWKAYARGRPLLLKEFREGSTTTHVFDIGQIQTEDIEAKLSQLSKWIAESYDKRYNFGLRLEDKLIQPSNGIDHLHRCLKELATYEAA